MTGRNVLHRNFVALWNVLAEYDAVCDLRPSWQPAIVDDDCNVVLRVDSDDPWLRRRVHDLVGGFRP